MQLLKIYPTAKETFGYITKEHRQFMGLTKEHYNDAIAIASLNNIEDIGCLNTRYLIDNIIYKKCISDGDFQQTKGVRSQQSIQTGKIMGFRKFDKVKYLEKEYFIKGRMSTGYAVLMDINGNKINFTNAPRGMKTPKLSNMKRIGSRKSWIIQAEIIPNVY